MQNIWNETVPLGLHPDANAVVGVSRHHSYSVTLVVEAFWDEERRVLDMLGVPCMEEGLRELPTLQTQELLTRLPYGKYTSAQLARRVIAVIDGWSQTTRAHLAGLLPYFDCSYCSQMQPQPARIANDSEIGKVRYQLPVGWYRVKAEGPEGKEGIACEAHKKDMARDAQHLVASTSSGLLLILERG